MFVTSSTKDNVVLVSYSKKQTFAILQLLVILGAMIAITITHAENMHATAK